jgi:hypothetical protein
MDAMPHNILPGDIKKGFSMGVRWLEIRGLPPTSIIAHILKDMGINFQRELTEQMS